MDYSNIHEYLHVQTSKHIITMLRPFQCLLGCLLENTGILLAASGSYIYSFDLLHGSLLSTWPPPAQTQPVLSKTLTPASQLVEEHSTGKNRLEILERPQKRRKNSFSAEVSHNASGGPVLSENGDDPEYQKSQVFRSTVIKLAGPTKDQCVVAVTEDKCIRVLRLSTKGVLTQLSERWVMLFLFECLFTDHTNRSMQKRPCAVILTRDEKSILCADKFGDVYSLPLMILSSQENNATTNDNHDKPSLDERTSLLKAPAANSRTVHTRRNQEALRNQQKVTNLAAKKKSLVSRRKLLLGHVSLLTDLACITLADETLYPPRQRRYILTSDRDEHIRVSRGIPQTHVIEGYCLGHTEFVAKLCIPDWNKKVLISGGGDDFLLIWDWLSGTARQKVDLKNLINNEFKKDHGTRKGDHSANEPSSAISDLSVSEDCSQRRITVSGIWDLRRTARESEGVEGEVIVTCEG